MVTYHRGPELIVKVTKDAKEIIEELAVQYTAMKILYEAVSLHREHVGDGVSSLVILISGLMAKANRLRTLGVHPMLIIHGYSEAAKKTIELIDSAAVDGDEASHERLIDIVDCGRGLLVGRLRKSVLDAIRKAAKEDRIDLEKIRILKKDGRSVEESELVDGIIIEKKKAHDNMPMAIDGPKIALVAKRLDIKPLDIKMPAEGHFPLKLDITSREQVRKFREGELKLKMQMVEKLKSAGANVVISRSPMADSVLDSLAREGIFAVMSIEQSEMDAISEATGAKIVGDVMELTENDLGNADRIEAGKIELEDIVTLRTKKGITLVLRSSSPELLAEVDRIVRNAIRVIGHSKTNGKLVHGGGAIQMHAATELRKFALDFLNKEQLAIEAFADALEEIPQCLARNYGFNPLDVLVKLRHGHSAGLSSLGVSARGCTDMADDGTQELANINKALISRAMEVSSLMLRIDNYIYVKSLAMVHKK